jgi:multidrug resistance efflux pump
LEWLRQAAATQLELVQDLAAPLVALAEADLALAEINLAALDNRPLESEKLAAESKLSEAQRQLSLASQRQEASRGRGVEGVVSQADFRRCELEAACARAGVTVATAERDELVSGASELERAVARADIELALSALSSARAFAEADIRAAAAGLSAAEAALSAYCGEAERRSLRAEASEVKSPVSGVSLWSVSEGADVEAGWPLVWVAEMTEGEVHAVLDESDYLDVRPGMPARVSLSGVPGRTYNGRTTQIAAWPEEWSWWRTPPGERRVRPGRLYQVTVKLQQRPPVCVGMSALVELLASEDAGVGVPEAANAADRQRKDTDA